MSPVIITLLVLLGVGLLLALWLLGIYNGLVVARNRFENAFAQIDVQLKRRYDLIPNLVEAVKGYMGHERETLDAVIKARNSAMAAEQKVAANPSDPAAMRDVAEHAPVAKVVNLNDIALKINTGELVLRGINAP